MDLLRVLKHTNITTEKDTRSLMTLTAVRLLRGIRVNRVRAYCE